MSNEIRSHVEPPAQPVRWSITLEGDLNHVQAAEETLLEYREYEPQVVHISQHEGDPGECEAQTICLTIELNWNTKAIEQMILQELSERTNDTVRINYRIITEDR